MIYSVETACCRSIHTRYGTDALVVLECLVLDNKIITRTWMLNLVIGSKLRLGRTADISDWDIELILAFKRLRFSKVEQVGLLLRELAPG